MDERAERKDRWTVGLSLGAITGMSVGIALEALVGGVGTAVGLGAAVAVAAGFVRRPLDNGRPSRRLPVR